MNNKFFHFKVIVLFCFVSLPLVAQKTKPSDQKTKNNGIGLNLTKVELIYRNVSVNQTYSSGNTYSYNLKIPRVKIDGGEPKDFDGKEMLKIFKNCPTAKKEVKLYLDKKKKANQYSLGGLLIGGGLGLCGVLVAAALEESGNKGAGAAFGVGFGLGVTTFVVGLSKARKYRKERDTHLRTSVEKYNQQCYSLPFDTLSEMNMDTIIKPNITYSDSKITGINENYKEDVYYKMLHNDPSSLKFWSIGISPLAMEAANNRGVSLYMLADFMINISPKFSLCADFKKAYVDNLSQSSNRNNYRNTTVAQFPSVDYSRAMKTDVLASMELFGNNRVKKHEVFLGSERMEGLNVQSIGTFDAIERISYVLRTGFSYENAIYYSENGLPVGSSTTGLTYEDDQNGIQQVPVESMKYAMPMVKSGCIILGFSRKKIVDYNIELLNNARFKGKHNAYGYSEYFIDAMYGSSSSSGDVNYKFDASGNGSEKYEYVGPLKTDLTEFTKLGFRCGYNSHFNGLGAGIEIGARPGISTGRGYFALNFFYRLANRF